MGPLRLVPFAVTACNVRDCREPNIPSQAPLRPRVRAASDRVLVSSDSNVDAAALNPVHDALAGRNSPMDTNSCSVWPAIKGLVQRGRAERFWLSPLLAITLGWVVPALAEDGGTPGMEPTQRYTERIRPVLHERCIACHGALKQESGLRLDTAALALRGGSGSAAIVPNDAEASSIVQRITSTDSDLRMPPDGEPLHAEQIDEIKQWIAQGAIPPEGEVADRDPREHWAFQPPERSAVPIPADPTWRENPIDAFLAMEWERNGMSPQGPASKAIWLRRVSLDLIGLPPTAKELEAFEANQDASAYDDVIDRLLSSPQHGERWGRHWMDVWRFSDWWGLGEEVRNSQKHMWHWRDWIIESIQEDKGYDQMLREMLAADELYPDDPDRLRAGGFLARQYFKFNRTTWMDETIEHTAKSMLGLTFNCSKCHDHKYDPISQEDYYRFRAIFEPYQVRMDMVPGESDFQRDGLPRPFDCNLHAETWLHVRGDDRNPDKSRVLEPSVPGFLVGATGWRIQPVELPIEAVHPELKSWVKTNLLAKATANWNAAVQKCDAVRVQYQAAVAALVQPAEPPYPAPSKSVEELQREVRLAEAERELAFAEWRSIGPRHDADIARYSQADGPERGSRLAAAATADRRVELAGALLKQTQLQIALETVPNDKQPELLTSLKAADAAIEVALKQLAAPGESYRSLRGSEKTAESNLESEDSRSKPFPSISSGRRSALANWITNRQNPLAARVAVNHIWMRHFGKPLVPTVFDFGRKGTPPTHPALLDFLAVEFMESGWSMKHLHRLITSSQAYRRTSSLAGAAPVNLTADPENRLLWRMNSQRMESQALRDSLLHLAGDLDLKRGGPSVPSNDDGSRRRSLYFFQSHNEHQKFLAIFDDANVLDCYRRAQSIVPQQALALENSPLVQSVSDKLLQRLMGAGSDADPDDVFARRAFYTILGWMPSPQELELAVRAMSQWRVSAEARQLPPDTMARQGLIRALINHNDFITIR